MMPPECFAGSHRRRLRRAIRSMVVLLCQKSRGKQVLSRNGSFTAPGDISDSGTFLFNPVCGVSPAPKWS
jgi:hypothetical protein